MDKHLVQINAIIVINKVLIEKNIIDAMNAILIYALNVITILREIKLLRFKFHSNLLLLEKDKIEFTYMIVLLCHLTTGHYFWLFQIIILKIYADWIMKINSTIIIECIPTPKYLLSVCIIRNYIISFRTKSYFTINSFISITKK